MDENRQMNGITIERLSAASQQLDRVADWTFDAWGHLHPEADIDGWRQAVAQMCGPAGVPSVFVAMKEGQALGTASLSPDDMSIRRELSPWLASVYVPPEQRGQGLASALVRRVEREARDHGIEWLHLYTPDQQSLYRRLGWEELEELDYLGERVTIMRRRLIDG
ncbi:GNAT family N-acetyltransferase [Halomonas sp.]|uniref:GNAT family N-acetyltransferase n=1 Tax=Halomonas sp. TaxID=1486246 RepID=UPI002580A48D|nr:GNAT family N-acetyltransferase [Halomonas sp.]|tara:strand:- start:1556 stop:2050 length:495 start_codon:yes stop_codon:yes gene_type:complete